VNSPRLSPDANGKDVVLSIPIEGLNDVLMGPVSDPKKFQGRIARAEEAQKQGSTKLDSQRSQAIVEQFPAMLAAAPTAQCAHDRLVISSVKEQYATNFLDQGVVMSFLSFLYKMTVATCQAPVSDVNIAVSNIGTISARSADGIRWSISYNDVAQRLEQQRQQQQANAEIQRRQIVEAQRQQHESEAKQAALYAVATSGDDHVTKIVKTYNLLWSRNVHSAGTTTAGPNLVIQLANPNGSLVEQLGCLKLDQGGYKCSFGAWGDRIVN